MMYMMYAVPDTYLILTGWYVPRGRSLCFISMNLACTQCWNLVATRVVLVRVLF